MHARRRVAQRARAQPRRTSTRPKSQALRQICAGRKLGRGKRREHTALPTAFPVVRLLTGVGKERPVEGYSTCGSAHCALLVTDLYLRVLLLCSSLPHLSTRSRSVVLLPVSRIYYIDVFLRLRTLHRASEKGRGNKDPRFRGFQRHRPASLGHFRRPPPSQINTTAHLSECPVADPGLHELREWVDATHTLRVALV